MKVAIVLALVATALAVPRSRFSGSGRIVGGEAAGDREFPHQVSIQVALSVGWSHLCGGVVYSETRIITAASCLVPYPSSSLRVVAGTNDIDSNTENEQIRGVATTELHDEYNPTTYDNDVGIVTLGAPLIFTASVQPIRIAESAFVASGDVVVTGYGTSDPNGLGHSGKLLKATFGVIDNDACDQQYDSVDGAPAVTQNMLCASASRKAICTGDTGSPLVAKDFANRDYLAGVGSWGALPCEGFPSVFTNIAPLREWLDSKLSP